MKIFPSSFACHSPTPTKKKSHTLLLRFLNDHGNLSHITNLRKGLIQNNLTYQLKLPVITHDKQNVLRIYYAWSIHSSVEQTTNGHESVDSVHTFRGKLLDFHDNRSPSYNFPSSGEVRMTTHF